MKSSLDGLRGWKQRQPETFLFVDRGENHAFNIFFQEGYYCLNTSIKIVIVLAKQSRLFFWEICHIYSLIDAPSVKYCRVRTMKDSKPVLDGWFWVFFKYVSYACKLLAFFFLKFGQTWFTQLKGDKFFSLKYFSEKVFVFLENDLDKNCWFS